MLISQPDAVRLRVEMLKSQAAGLVQNPEKLAQPNEKLKLPRETFTFRVVFNSLSEKGVILPFFAQKRNFPTFVML
jgi:hypothetical protein